MANWGAFAGGLTKGYLAGEDMRETRKRTALMGEEVDMRRQDAARRATEFEWRKKQQELDAQVRDEMAAYHNAQPWALGADGKIDMNLPENAKIMDGVIAHQYAVKAKANLLTPAEQKTWLELQDISKNKEVSKLAGQFGTTYDLTHLQNDKVKEATGIDFTGATMVQDKQPWGTTNHILLADGKTRVPASAILMALGPTGKSIAAGIGAEEDNARQSYETKERVANMKRDDARAERAAREARERFQQDQETGKVNDILAVKRYINEGILTKPEKNPLTGETKEADPVWNTAAKEMLAERMKKYGAKKEDVARAASEADDIQSEIRSALGEVDAQARKDIADARKAGKNPDEAAVRRQFFANFKKNGFVIPDKKEEQPVPASTRGAALQKPTVSGSRAHTRGGSYPVEPGSSW